MMKLIILTLAAATMVLGAPGRPKARATYNGVDTSGPRRLAKGIPLAPATYKQDIDYDEDQVSRAEEIFRSLLSQIYQKIILIFFQCQETWKSWSVRQRRSLSWKMIWT